jgi:hypothetical protein
LFIGYLLFGVFNRIDHSHLFNTKQVMPPKRRVLQQVKAAAKSVTTGGVKAPKLKIRLFRDIPTLQFVQNEQSPNYGAWFDKLVIVAMGDYPDVYMCLIKHEYDDIEDVALPTQAEEALDAASGGYGRETRKMLIKIRMDRLKQRETDKAKLFSLIMQTLSPESIEALEQIPTYADDIQYSNDPLALFEAIELTHLTHFAEDTDLMEDKAVEGYFELAQYTDESLILFCKRCEMALKCYDALEMERPSQREQVRMFLKAVDQDRYGVHIADLQQRVREGDRKLPATRHDAYLFLVGRVPDKPGALASASGVTVEPVVDSAFTAVDSTDSKRNKGNSGGKAKAKGPDSGAGRNAHKGSTQNNKSSGYTVKRLPRKDCPVCARLKDVDDRLHWSHECPHLESCHKHLVREQSEKKKKEQRAYQVLDESSDDGMFLAITDSICAAAAAARTSQPADLYIDCASSAHIVANASLLTNIRPLQPAHTVRGVGGKVKVNLQGELGGFGTVMHHPDFGVNLLSQSKTVQNPNLDLDYVKAQDTFVVTDRVSGSVYRFTPKHGLYACDASQIASGECTEDAAMITTTVEENKKLYTLREVKGAEAAADLERSLGFPSARDMYRLLRGGIKGSDVTVQDFVRKLAIYGPSVPAMQGKTVRRAPVRVNTEFVPAPLVSTQTLHADLLFVEKIPFLTSVSEPLGLTICSHLAGGKGVPSLRRAMVHHISQYAAQGFKVKKILFDGEGAIGAIKDHLGTMGVALQQAGPGAHVPVVERKHRVIQERVRAVKAGLWFNLPMVFVVWLVYYCVSRINLMPSNLRVDPASPRDNFLRRTVDFKRDLSVSFGDYLQVHEHRAVTNTLEPRTQAAVALLPLGNQEGSCKVYLLESKKVVTRTRWTVIKNVPDDIVKRMNAIAAAEKVAVNPTPRFENAGGQALPVETPAPAPKKNPLAHLAPPVHNPEPIEDPVPFLAASDPAPQAEHAPAQTSEPPPVVQPTPTPTADPTETAAVTAGVEAERRYPARDNRTSWHQARTFNEHVVNHITVRKALDKFGEKALRSMFEEMMQMPDKQVFTPQDPRKLSHAEKRTVISSSMFLKEKFSSTGDFEKLKARLVAGGHQQDKSTYQDVSSPTVATSAAFMIAALAAHEGRTVVTVDIAGAYLNASMTGQMVLMRLDALMSAILIKIKPEYKTFLFDDGSMIVKLDKALYGCIESAKLWYEDIAATLLSMGFARNPVDPCVFNKGHGSKQISVCLHVDDLMVTCTSGDVIDDLLAALTAKYKTLTVHGGKVHSYLGMTLDFSTGGKVRITMDGYVNELLEAYDVTGKAATPATVNLFDIRESPSLRSADAQVFHSRVAKLLYLAKRVRPDILTAIAFLSTRTKEPVDDDMAKLDRVLRYLNGTKDFGIVLEVGKNVCVITYADAAYGVHADGKSHSGLSITLGRGAVFVRSAKQKIVSKSSTESELIGLSDSLSQAIWTRDFLIGQGYTMGPATVYQDNMSAIALAAKGKSTSDRTRHIHIRYFFVKDRVDAGEISVEYKPTTMMLADLLTKPLQGDLFRAMRKDLLNWD